MRQNSATVKLCCIVQHLVVRFVALCNVLSHCRGRDRDNVRCPISATIRIRSRKGKFNTPYGRYRWLRMPFGISTASEEFQRRQNQPIEGLDGVHSMEDDILVYGECDPDYDAIKNDNKKLIALLERCRENGIKLN